ncbi:MAG: c-type cytochrome [Candidatus Eiseniibacteriota bacterium]
MPRRHRTAALFLILLSGACAALGFFHGPEASGAPGKGDPAKGKAIFSKNCVVCHNADGSGGKKLTPNGNPSRDFRDAKFWSERTDDQIRMTINKGVAKSGMIAWKGILKPQEIEDVMAFIKTFPKAAPADAKAAPADAKPAAPKTPGASDSKDK